MRRTILACAVFAGALWYLRDPAWLATTASGMRPWQQSDGVRYRWTGGHASFFVPSSATIVRIPVSTTFRDASDPPMIVTFTIDDRRAAQVALTDAAWHDVVLRLPAAATRRVRRIDIRTNVVRDDNHGVRVAEIAADNAGLGSTR